MSAPILQLESISSGYSDEPIVTDLSLAVPPGSITTFIGPNGAGKSTLLKTVYGLTRMFSGRILFEGRDLRDVSPSERLRQGIGFVPQGRCNFSHLSVAENLALGAWTLPRRALATARDGVLALFPMLRDRLRVQAGNLSGGEQQILEMAMVLEAAPRLLLLDEPSLGLSPANQTRIFETVRSIRDSGVTVLIVEQNTHGALTVSDTAVVLELGRKVIEAPAREVQADPRIRAVYLGGDATA